MRVLITGGLGYIGGEVAQRLLARGVDVRVADLPRISAVRPPSHPNLEVRFVDVTRPAALASVVEGMDVVIHAAGIHHADEVVRHPNRHVEVNVHGTFNVLRAAVDAGVRRVVQLSSAKVYGPSYEASLETDLVRPSDDYALGKVVAESYCAHFAATTPLEVCALRPFSVYGPGMDLRTGYCGALLDALVTGVPAVVPGRPDYTRDFVHLSTVADVVIAAAGSEAPPPPLLNVGSGVATSLAELVDAFSTHLGHRLCVTYSEPRPGTLDRTLADISLMTGFACPEIPELRTAVSEMIDAHHFPR